MTRTYRARIATSERYWLAEGILWDDRTAQALWVDIHNGNLVRDLEHPVVTHLDATVGAVALADDGGLLLAGHRGLIAISDTGEVSYGPDLLEGRETARLNDGSVDAQGRFLVGTLSMVDRGGDEKLLRISPDGTVETLRTGLSLSNGIGFLSDGTIVHADTWNGTVALGRDGDWNIFLDDLPGYPDGLTVDADDNIWVALYGAGLVQQFTPRGELLANVELDTVEATCVGFLADGILAITTGAEEARDDNAGAIYLAEVDGRRVAENRWAGSTSNPYWKDPS